MYTDDNKLVKMTEPKSISFNFTEKADNSLMHEVNHIIKHNGLLTENRKKKRDWAIIVYIQAWIWKKQ